MKTSVIILILLFGSTAIRSKEESVKKQLRLTERDFTEIQLTDKPARIQVKLGQGTKVNPIPEVRNSSKNVLMSKVNTQTVSGTNEDKAAVIPAMPSIRARKLAGSITATAVEAAKIAFEKIKQYVNETEESKEDVGARAFPKAGSPEEIKNSFNFTDEFIESLDILSDELRDYLNHTNIKELQEDARSFLAINLPQAGLFGNLLGFRTAGLSNFAFLTFLGWPFLLGLLYVGLIVVNPNRRSDNAFEKNLSTMVENMSYMFHKAEDKFLDFLEDITDPGPSYHDAYGSYSEFHPAYALPDPDDRQEVLYKPTAYYDEYGAHFDAEEDFSDDQQRHDSWGNPAEEAPSFVNPQGEIQNPVASSNIATPSAPLREQFQRGDLSNLGNNFDIQNEIAKKDKHNFLNVILGTHYQHSRPPSSSLTYPLIVQGSVATEPSNRPLPPKGYRPSRISAPSAASSSSNISFEAATDPRLKEETESSNGFRPSKLENPHTGEFEDHWRARPHPLPKGYTRLRFPEARHLQQRPKKEEEPLEIILIDDEEESE